MEMKARGATVIAICEEGDDGISFSFAPFCIGGCSITPFAVPHDVEANTCGLNIEAPSADGPSRFAYETDLGVFAEGLLPYFDGCGAIMLEFNHDERMLIDGPYPWPLKKRIMSNVGHLSNDAAASELESLADGPVSVLILAHLSKENNRPDLALSAASAALESVGRRDVSILVSDPNETVGPIDIGIRGRRGRGKAGEGVGATCTR